MNKSLHCDISTAANNMYTLGEEVGIADDYRAKLMFYISSKYYETSSTF